MSSWLLIPVMVFIINQLLIEFVLRPIIHQKIIISDIEFLLESCNKYINEYSDGDIWDWKCLSKKLDENSMLLKRSLSSILFYDIFSYFGIVPFKENIYNASFDLEVISMDVVGKGKNLPGYLQQKDAHEREFTYRFLSVYKKLRLPKFKNDTMFFRYKWKSHGARAKRVIKNDDNLKRYLDELDSRISYGGDAYSNFSYNTITQKWE